MQVYEEQPVAPGYQEYEEHGSTEQSIVPLEADVFLLEVASGAIIGSKGFVLTAPARYEGPNISLPGGRPAGMRPEQIEYRVLGMIDEWIRDAEKGAF